MAPFSRIPDHVSPQQLDLLIEVIDALQQWIWSKYGDQIEPVVEPPFDDDEPTGVDFDDGPPW